MSKRKRKRPQNPQLPIDPLDLMEKGLLRGGSTEEEEEEEESEPNRRLIGFVDGFGIVVYQASEVIKNALEAVAGQSENSLSELMNQHNVSSQEVQEALANEFKKLPVLTPTITEDKHYVYEQVENAQRTTLTLEWNKQDGVNEAFSVKADRYTGVLRVKRVDQNGNYVDIWDTIEFKNGEPVAVALADDPKQPVDQQTFRCRISNARDLLRQSKPLGEVRDFTGERIAPAASAATLASIARVPPVPEGGALTQPATPPISTPAAALLSPARAQPSSRHVALTQGGLSLAPPTKASSAARPLASPKPAVSKTTKPKTLASPLVSPTPLPLPPVSSTPGRVQPSDKIPAAHELPPTQEHALDVSRQLTPTTGAIVPTDVAPTAQQALPHVVVPNAAALTSEVPSLVLPARPANPPARSTNSGLAAGSPVLPKPAAPKREALTSPPQIDSAPSRRASPSHATLSASIARMPTVPEGVASTQPAAPPIISTSAAALSSPVRAQPDLRRVALTPEGSSLELPARPTNPPARPTKAGLAAGSPALPQPVVPNITKREALASLSQEDLTPPQRALPSHEPHSADALLRTQKHELGVLGQLTPTIYTMELSKVPEARSRVTEAASQTLDDEDRVSKLLAQLRAELDAANKLVAEYKEQNLADREVAIRAKEALKARFEAAIQKLEDQIKKIKAKSTLDMGDKMKIKLKEQEIEIFRAEVEIIRLEIQQLNKKDVGHELEQAKSKLAAAEQSSREFAKKLEALKLRVRDIGTRSPRSTQRESDPRVKSAVELVSSRSLLEIKRQPQASELESAKRSEDFVAQLDASKTRLAGFRSASEAIDKKILARAEASPRSEVADPPPSMSVIKARLADHDQAIEDLKSRHAAQERKIPEKKKAILPSVASERGANILLHIDDLTDVMCRVNKDIKRATARKENLRHDIEALGESTKANSLELGVKQRLLAKVEQELEALTSKQKKLKSRIESCVERIRQKRELEDLRKQLDKFQRQAALAQKIADREIAAAEVQRFANKEAEGRAAVGEEEATARANMYSSMISKVAESASAMEAKMKREMEGIQAEAKQAEVKLKEWQGHYAKLSEKLIELKMQASSDAEQITQLRADFSAVSKEARDVEAENVELIKLLNSRRGEIAQEKASLEKQRAAIDEFRVELGIDEARKHKEIEELKTTIKTKSEEADKLKSQLKERQGVEERNAELIDQISKLESELKLSQKRHERVEQTLTQVEARKVELEEAVKNFESVADSLSRDEKTCESLRVRAFEQSREMECMKVDLEQQLAEKAQLLERAAEFGTGLLAQNKALREEVAHLGSALKQRMGGGHKRSASLPPPKKAGRP